MTPTRRSAVVAAAIALGALVVPRAAVTAAMIVLGIAIVVDALFARRPIRLQRAVAPVLIIGQPSPVNVTAASSGQRDQDLGKVAIRQPRTADLRVEPGVMLAPYSATITALRRGLHAIPAVAARRTGPLGLGSWDFRGDGTTTVTVYPDVPTARRIAHAVRTRAFIDAGEIRRGPLGLGTEFESIREYQPDDDVRQVNWQATMRVGRPMSNQYRVETERQVLCLLDCGRLMAAPIGDRTRLDIAIDAVTAVAHVADVLGDRSGVIAFDRSVLRNLGDRRRGADALVHSIHDLEPSEYDSDYDLAFRNVRNTKRALVVVMTDLLDEAAATSLVDAVPVLARRHAVLVCSVNDPQLSAALTQPPTDNHSLYRSVAAIDMADARQQVRLRLQATGATVVEAEPTNFSAAVVRAYLRMKDSARL